MPIIPVTLRRGDLLVVTELLVDSGVASSTFDAQFCEMLGIHDVEGDGHQLIGYRHEVTIEVGGHSFASMPIACSLRMPDNRVHIHGQHGFFELIPIKFTHTKREIELMSSGAEPAVVPLTVGPVLNGDGALQYAST